MTLEGRLAALDAKFTKFSALIVEIQKLYADVLVELGAIADEYGDEGGMLAMERLLKFQAALRGCQRGLYRAEAPAKSEPKKPNFSVQ
jgi:hypothetical protein